MDRTESHAFDHEDGLADARSRLRKRLLLAAVMIFILLGALAAFDHLSRLERDVDRSDADAAKTAVPKVGPALRSDGNYPVGAPPPPPIQESVAVAAKPDAPPAPEVTAQPTVPSPVSPPSLPAASTATVARPVLPAVRPIIAERPSPAAAAVPEGSAGGEIKPAAAPAASPVTAKPPVHPLLRRGYILQTGVFTSTERAEEMKARLILAGVPVTIESKVQVGPFSSAQDAAAAREKIRALGIESILIPPARSKAPGR